MVGGTITISSTEGFLPGSLDGVYAASQSPTGRQFSTGNADRATAGHRRSDCHPYRGPMRPYIRPPMHGRRASRALRAAALVAAARSRNDASLRAHVENIRCCDYRRRLVQVETNVWDIDRVCA